MEEARSRQDTLENAKIQADDRAVPVQLIFCLEVLGNYPIHLQVQYQIHLCLFELPSNLYEGFLQNGVMAPER